MNAPQKTQELLGVRGDFHNPRDLTITEGVEGFSKTDKKLVGFKAVDASLLFKSEGLLAVMSNSNVEKVKLGKSAQIISEGFRVHSDDIILFQEHLKGVMPTKVWQEKNWLLALRDFFITWKQGVWSFMERLKEIIILKNDFKILLLMLAGPLYGELLDSTSDLAQSIQPARTCCNKSASLYLPSSLRVLRPRKVENPFLLSKDQRSSPFHLEGGSSYGNRFQVFWFLKKMCVFIVKASS